MAGNIVYIKKSKKVYKTITWIVNLIISPHTKFMYKNLCLYIFCKEMENKLKISFFWYVIDHPN